MKFFPFILTSCCLALLTTAACSQSPEFAYDFEADEELDRLLWKCGTGYSLSEAYASSGAKSLKVDLYPASSGSGNIYPGISFIHFSRNWTGRNSLAFEVTNPAPESLSLTLRLDDRDAPPYQDRYNGKLEIEPGLNSFKIPFTRFVTSGTQRKLRTDNISSVLLFLEDPETKHTLYFDNFRLLNNDGIERSP